MATTYELIASQTLGSDAATVTFSSIPGTFDDLVFVYSVRTTTAVVGENIKARFNGAGSDTNHSARRLSGNGSTAASSTQAYLLIGTASGSSSTADSFGSGEMYIPNYAGGSNKSCSMTSVQETNAIGASIYVLAGLWSDTSAITDIEILPVTGNLKTGSTFDLYGITKA